MRPVATRTTKGLTDLVGALSTRSSTFRTLWAAHDVRHHRTGTRRIHYRVVGDLDLAYESMAFTADDGLALQPALWAAPAWMADTAVSPDGGSALRD